jgi:hypothetical protein
MANREHMQILIHGVEVWNKWREENINIRPDFSHADLSDFYPCDLPGVNFSEGIFHGANLSEINLEGVNFSWANLRRTNFCRTNLSYANFDSATLDRTVFGDVDLSALQGLNSVSHLGPSTIGIDTILRSQGNISEIFLRKAGCPNTVIEYARSLAHAINPIDYYTCFLSYSSKDHGFSERLYADLQAKGVRCWFAPHDMRIGDKIRPRIDESIRLYDKLLLILSRDSVASQWVEHEVETAIGKELESIPNVLFPIRLDEAVMESKTGWASHIRLTRHIGDFTNWKTHDEYLKAFDRLLRDLKAGE